MIIAVNTISFFKNGSQRTYLWEAFEELARRHPADTFLFITEDGYGLPCTAPTNCSGILTVPFPKNTLRWRLLLDYRIPLILKNNRADVFISADVCSLRSRVPQCIICGDLAPLIYPTFFPSRAVNYFQKDLAKYLHKAKVVITSYGLSGKILMDKFNLPENKVQVVPQGITGISGPVDFYEQSVQKEKYAEGNEYFLFAGELTDKNNLMNLLKAFSLFKKRLKSSMQMVICTSRASLQPEFAESLRLFRYKNEVKLVYDPGVKELSDIIAGAYALVYPAWFRAFDIAPLLGMQRGVALIMADTAENHELCGEAALYTNPSDHKMIADKLMLVFKDEDLRKQLVMKGSVQLTKYSGDARVSLLWNSILKTFE